MTAQGWFAIALITLAMVGFGLAQILDWRKK
jgi:hypothetical protein